MSKGSSLDILGIFVMLFITGVVVLFGYLILSNFSGLGLGDVFESYISKGLVALRVFNYGFLFLLAGFGIGSVIGAFMIDTHPVFFVISIILTLFFVFIGTTITNVFEGFVTADELTATAEQFNIMVLIMRNLPKIGIIWGSIIAIVLYGKIRGRGI